MSCALCDEPLDCCRCFLYEDGYSCESDYFKLLVGDIEDD